MRKPLVAFILCCVLWSGESANLTGSFGVFNSPGFPSTYGNNLDLDWSIIVKRGFRVVLYFTSFELEDSYDEVPCAYDYIEIDTGANSTSRFCGNPRIFPDDAPRLFKTKFRSSGNSMRLRLASDYSNKLVGSSDEPLSGFRAHYFREDVNECLEKRNDEACDHFCNNYPGGYYCSCRRGYKLHPNQRTCVGDCTDKVILEDSGRVTSPGYPAHYPSLTECRWRIKTDPGKQVEINFGSNFAIESHFRALCPYDYVTISDASGQRGAKFCGSIPPFNGSLIRSTTNWFDVRFYSDYAGEHRGFELYYNSRGIVCELPDPPAYGRVSLVDDEGTEQQSPGRFVPYSALILFKCDGGFRLVGSGKLTCLKDGSLSDRIPICIPF